VVGGAAVALAALAALIAVRGRTATKQQDTAQADAAIG